MTPRWHCNACLKAEHELKDCQQRAGCDCAACFRAERLVLQGIIRALEERMALFARVAGRAGGMPTAAVLEPRPSDVTTVVTEPVESA